MSTPLPNATERASDRLRIMRLIYSDEAGVGDATHEPFTVVAAVVIHPDEQWGGVNSAINSIVDGLVSEQSRPAFEFKAARLFKRRDKGNNAEILHRFLSIIPEHGLAVAAGIVERAWVYGRSGSEDIGLLQDTAFVLCATCVETLFKRSIPDEKGLWIADRTRYEKLMKTSLRANQERAVDLTIPLMHLEHIVDTIYFGNSHESRMLQLADACNAIVKQHFMGTPAAEEFYRIIEPSLVQICLPDEDTQP